MFYTYIHTKPNGDIFYVGKGTHRRAWKTHRRNSHWKSIVQKHGSFSVQILANWETEQEAFSHEMLLINCFKDMGYLLANKTNGGEGASGYKHSDNTKLKMKHSVSEETKKKISIARKGKYAGENHPLFGKPLSEKTKEKISIANMGGHNNPKTKKIKFNGILYTGIQSLADFQKVHYKTIMYRIKTNPVKHGYEVVQ